MKALMIKDFYTLLRQVKLYIFMIIIFACIPSSDISMSAFAIVYAAMLPITALAYDERSKWDEMALVMPYSVNSIVVSKYLLGYITIGGATVLSMLSQMAVCVIKRAPIDMQSLTVTAGVLGAGTIILSITLPLMFKFTVEKGRMLFIAIIAATSIITATIAGAINIDEVKANAMLLMIFATLIIVALNVASIMLSKTFYKSKAR